MKTDFVGELKKFVERTQPTEVVSALKAELDHSATGSRRGTLALDLAKQCVEDLFVGDQLSFIHNEPSYLSPGEFFHRVFTAYTRPRLDGRETACAEGIVDRVSFVVVDGWDQLETKFPSCAAERLFVPSLVTIFKVEGTACALFLSSQESVADEQASASMLIPLSDLLLQFSDPVLTDDEKDRRGLKFLMSEAARLSKEKPAVSENIAFVQAIKVPFGEVGISNGILWTANYTGQLRFNHPDISSTGPGYDE